MSAPASGPTSPWPPSAPHPTVPPTGLGQRPPPATPPPAHPHWGTPAPVGHTPVGIGTPRPPGQGTPHDPGVSPAVERYVDRQLIGRGGMGSVFKAYDARLHRSVALKIMHADLQSQPGFLERFIREARVAAMLDHPNIVTVYDIEPVGDSIHMVMAWIEGEDLQKIIRREGGLPLDRTARLLDQIASALDHAHHAPQPVLHRDIKPSNIMVGPGDRAILTDFGIARLIGDAALTQLGQMVGTPAYMAPEVVRGEDADGRADVYALGVVLFEMLTGRTPFRAETPLALLHQQVHTPPPTVRTVAPQLPPGVDGVLMRALAKDRAQRFQTAGALARAYRAAVGFP
jgi:serine/threonine protein kinase